MNAAEIAPDMLAALRDCVGQLETLRLERTERWSNERTNSVSVAVSTARAILAQLDTPEDK